MILMERDSPEVWFNSYYGMFTYYRENFYPCFIPLLSMLSKTHHKLGKYENIHVIYSNHLIVVREVAYEHHDAVHSQ